MEKCDKCGEFIEFARLCPLCAHYEKERLKRSAKKCEERAIKAEALARELTDALKKIAYPWVYLQKEAEKNNRRLDGAMAYQLGNDAYWLKSEARTALNKIKEVLGDE